MELSPLQIKISCREKIINLFSSIEHRVKNAGSEEKISLYVFGFIIFNREGAKNAKFFTSLCFACSAYLLSSLCVKKLFQISAENRKNILCVLCAFSGF